jgi:hypothetical protein
MEFPAKIKECKRMLLPLMDDKQQRLLYPQKGSFSVNHRDLGLSILYILLMNVCGIPAHEKGWGRFPNPADNSLAANIDRIMEIHRSHSGDTPSKILNQSDFDRVMKEVIQISGKIEGILEGPTTDVNDFQKAAEIEREHDLEALKGMVIYNN